MQHLDEGIVHAWLDGELSADRAADLEGHAAECPECAAMIAEARGLVAASTRILTALDDVPAGVLPEVAAASTASIPYRRWYDRTNVRAAAALLFVAAASLVVVTTRDSRAPVATLATAGRVQSVPVVSRDTAAIKSAESAAVVPQRRVSADEVSAPPIAAKPAARQAPRVAEEKSRELALGKERDKVGVSNTPVSALDTDVKTSLGGVTMGLGGTANRLRAEPTPMKATAQAAPKAVPPSNPQAASVLMAEVLKDVAAPLRVVCVDTLAGTRRTVYEVSSGVQVTLLESPVGVAEKDFNARRSAAPPAADAGSASPPVNTISWSDSGQRFTLTGPLSTNDLEALKKRLLEMRR